MFAREIRASKGFVIFVVCVAYFTDMLLSNLIVPMLPYALLERVGLPEKDVQKWNSILLALYGGSQMVGSLFFGWVGDRISSRQTPFIFGLLALGATTALFALGTTLPILLIARILQGLSGAITFTIGSTLLYDAVGKEGIGQAGGYTTMSVSLGILTGPVAGGILYEYGGGYVHVFIPAFVLIAVDIILRLMVVCERRVESTKVEEPMTETEPLLGHAGHNVARVPIFVLLSSARFMVALLSLFAINSFSNGFDSVLPVYAYQEFGIRPSQVAVLFLALCVPTLLSPIIGRLTDRIGAKWPATAGLGLMVPSLILLRLIVPGSAAPVAKLVALLFSMGCAITLANPPLITEITASVREIEQARPGIFGPHGAFAQAYGLAGCSFAMGSMIGPLYAGYVKEKLGWPAMSLLMGVLSSISLVFVFVVTGGSIFQKGQAARSSKCASRDSSQS